VTPIQRSKNINKDQQSDSKQRSTLNFHSINQHYHSYHNLHR